MAFTQVLICEKRLLKSEFNNFSFVTSYIRCEIKTEYEGYVNVPPERLFQNLSCCTIPTVRYNPLSNRFNPLTVISTLLWNIPNDTMNF